MPGRFPQKYRALWAGLTFTASIRIGLHWKQRGQTMSDTSLKQFVLCYRAERIECNHLEESADIWLVVGTHENDVLKQPEERAVVALLRLQHGQYAVELKEEPSSALCGTNRESYQKVYEWRGCWNLKRDLKHSQLKRCLTKQSFPQRVDHRQVVTRTASNQKIKWTPFSQLQHKVQVRFLKLFSAS